MSLSSFEQHKLFVYKATHVVFTKFKCVYPRKQLSLLLLNCWVTAEPGLVNLVFPLVTLRACLFIEKRYRSLRYFCNIQSNRANSASFLFTVNFTAK